MTWVMWTLTSFRFETVLVSVQDRCIVCARRTIGSDIILDAPDDMGHGESRSVRLEMVLVLM